MTTLATRYVLDANVFIEAHKRYYAFDICPGYWSAILANHGAGRLHSIDRVRDELVGQGDALSKSAQQAPDSLFVATSDSAVTTSFTSIMTWLQGQPQFLPAAKVSFAAGADGWLIAYAKTNGLVLATDEAPNPTIKRRVPIPNVCNAFGVNFIGTFDLLRALGTRFT